MIKYEQDKWLLLAFLLLLPVRDVPDMPALAYVTSFYDTPAVATPRLFLAYLQLLRLWDASDMSSDACVTSVDTPAVGASNTPVVVSLPAAVACL